MQFCRPYTGLLGADPIEHGSLYDDVSLYDDDVSGWLEIDPWSHACYGSVEALGHEAHDAYFSKMK